MVIGDDISIVSANNYYFLSPRKIDKKIYLWSLEYTHGKYLLLSEKKVMVPFNPDKKSEGVVPFTQFFDIMAVCTSAQIEYNLQKST